MKFRISFLATVLVLGTLVYSCKEKEKPKKTDEEINTELLSKAWVPQTGANATTVAGNDVSDIWAGFVLTMGDKTYSSSGADAPEVWPASGTWAFGTDANTLVRNDGIEIAISVSETTLVMKFNYSASGGRLSGLEGDWVFNMIPQ
jgi:hypothetical protein